MSRTGNDRRKSVRYDYPATVEYVLLPSSGSGRSRAVTINISETGLCLYVFEMLDESQELKILDRLPASHQRARIRWIREVDEGFYKAGLVFVHGS